jgi:signal transduction histidine kinase
VALETAREARRRLDENATVDPSTERRALDEMVEALEDAQRAGQRIAQIVKDLAMFGRPNPQRVRGRAIDIVEGAMRWLVPTLGRTATVEVEHLEAPDVVASTGQIEQVIVNLVTNAVKASPPGEKGRVIVRVRGGDGRVVIEVVDHGVGIPPDILQHIFDPFFTTRPTGDGRGTGLGLAISHAIVTAHGGTITVESEVGKGSTFRVELPAAPVEA